MISRFVSSRADALHTIARVGAGTMFACHGLQKFFGVLGGHAQPVGSQAWFGAVIELTTSAALIVGFQTSLAALAAAAMLVVAYAQFHWKFSFDARFFPIVNKGELALVYVLLFLLVASREAGPLSLDAALRRRAQREDAPG